MSMDTLIALAGETNALLWELICMTIGIYILALVVSPLLVAILAVWDTLSGIYQRTKSGGAGTETDRKSTSIPKF